jgi:dihydrodipicolinate synthase/N-acetylneuraminate lyase
MMMRLGLLPSAEVRLPLVPIADAARKASLDDVLRRAGLLAPAASIVR